MNYLQRAYTIKEACQELRIGKTSLYEAAKSGGLRLTHITQRRTVILREDMEAYIAKQRDQTRH